MIIDEGTEIQVDTLYKIRSSDGNHRSNRYPTIETDGADVCDVHISIRPDAADQTNMPKKISNFGATGGDIQTLEAEGAYLYVKKTNVLTPKIWTSFKAVAVI